MVGKKGLFELKKCTVSGLKRQLDKWHLFSASTRGGSQTVFGEGLYGMFSPPLSFPPPLFFSDICNFQHLKLPLGFGTGCGYIGNTYQRDQMVSNQLLEALSYLGKSASILKASGAEEGGGGGQKNHRTTKHID